MNWKILSSEYLFSDLWFKVRKDKCETPQGKIVDPYYVYEFPTWVTAVALTNDGKIILERQYRHALGEVCIEIPGGCVDDTDSNLEEAIKRELLEETGYTASRWKKILYFYVSPGFLDETMSIYLAEDLRPGIAQPEEDEKITTRFIPLSETLRMVDKGLIRDAKTLASVLWLARHKRKSR